MNAHHHRVRTLAGRGRARGFTMVELMIAMLLGLIVIAGVSSVFLANLRSYKSNTALSDVQSNSRIAFELMARDIRQAGLTGCNSIGSAGSIDDVLVANVLNNGPYLAATPAWWARWETGVSAVVGYASSVIDPAITGAMPARAASTDSLMVMEASGEGLTVASADTTSNAFTFSNASSKIQPGDIIIVCNPDHATIMQATAYDAGSKTITHAVGSATSPGNCNASLFYVTSCDDKGNSDYLQARLGLNAKISKLAVHDWYIGTNPVGGKSLYRIGLFLDAGTPKPTAQEMVRNVTGMSIDYHQSGDADFVTADAVTNWASVDAVHVTFTVQSADQRAGTNAKPLTRTFASTITIRNRM